MRNKAMPFGFLFQEPAVDLGETPVPVYDEERDISFIEQDGEAVPFVTAVPPRMATRTHTAVAREPTDADVDPANLSRCLRAVRTETKIERESTDRSPAPSLLALMKTQTVTRIRREQTDED